MTRTKYLEHRNKGELGNIVYYKYSETCDKMGCSKMDIRKFIELFQMWPGQDVAIAGALEEYDIYFEIYTLTDPRGKAISYL